MDNWVVDLSENTVRHGSGFLITFEGVPDTDNFTGHPKNYPKAVNPLELSRLIREGFAEYRAAWKRREKSTLSTPDVAAS